MNDPISVARTSLSKKLTQAVSYELSGGWFTPEMPLVPQHPETAGRRYDYLAGFNISTQPRRDSGIDFLQLRNLAQYYDILRIIIEKRKDQISNFEWSLVPTDVAVGEKPDPDVQKDIAYATKFLKTPDGRLSWSRWLRQIVEDYLVLDAVALWPVYKGKECQRIETIDPATIKLVIDESGRRPEPPFPAYQQVLHGVVTSNYQRDELRYFISNPRSHALYGFSKVEQILITAQIGLRREVSQLQFFTEGNIPDAIAGVPDNWTPQQISILQAGFDAMLAGNTGERRKLKFIPGDASKIMMLKGADAVLKSEFDEWLIRIICFTFGVSPTPFIKQVNRATAETAAEEAREEGLGPSLAYIKDIIDTILHSVLRLPEIEFRWSTQQDVDPGVQATIDDTEIRSGVVSIDEVRQRKGLEALGIKNMVYLPTGPVPLSMYKDGTAPNLQQPATPPGEPPSGGKPPGGKPPDESPSSGEKDEERPTSEKIPVKKSDLPGHASIKKAHAQEGRPSRAVPFVRPSGSGTKHDCALHKAKYGDPNLPIYRHVAPKVDSFKQDVHRALLHICSDITKKMVAKGRLKKSADAHLRKGDVSGHVFHGNQYVDGALVSSSIEAFGTTESMSEAGYILPGGQLLDFSGKRDGGSPGMRSYDHRQIREADDVEGASHDPLDSDSPMSDFMDRTGSIRVHQSTDQRGRPSETIATVTRMPDDAALRRLVKESPNGLVLAVGFDRYHSLDNEKVFDEPSIGEIKSFISDYQRKFARLEWSAKHGPVGKGDVAGHAFHGNRYTGGIGGSDVAPPKATGMQRGGIHQLGPRGQKFPILVSPASEEDAQRFVSMARDMEEEEGLKVYGKDAYIRVWKGDNVEVAFPAVVGTHPNVLPFLRDAGFVGAWGLHTTHSARGSGLVRSVSESGGVSFSNHRVELADRGGLSKGDVSGHVFHGNQWVVGQDGGSKTTKIDMARVTEIRENANQQLKEMQHAGVNLFDGRDLNVVETYITKEQYDEFKARLSKTVENAGVPVDIAPGHSFVLLDDPKGRVSAQGQRTYIAIKPSGCFSNEERWEDCRISLFADEMLLNESVRGVDPVKTLEHEIEHAKFHWATMFSPDADKINAFITANHDRLAEEDGNYVNARRYWEAAAHAMDQSNRLFRVALSESLAYTKQGGPMDPEKYPTYTKLNRMIQKAWKTHP